jgi:hypothetical protein
MNRLRNIFFSLITLIIVTEAGVIAQVTPSGSATGHIFAEIIPVFTATETSQMNFGKFSPGPKGGEIILSPESTVSVLGSVNKGPGSQNAATFYVTGDADASYTISLPPGQIILTHTATAKTMKIKDWVSSPAPGVGSGKLNNGYQIVRVGATLIIGNLNDNPVGSYTGTYVITFDFN